MSRHDIQPTDVTGVQRQAREFASEYAHLSLYRRLAEGLAGDDEVAALLLSAQPGQTRPVLILAALHDLVLREPDLPAAQWYPSITGAAASPAGDPWPDVRAAALDHAESVREVIATHTTQTNEVNRSVYLAALLTAACADLPDAPVTLVEQGASAGLLLGVDRYSTTLVSASGQTSVGPRDALVRCEGVDRSAAPLTLRLPSVAARVGVDLHPADLRDADTVRWLEACLWPDLPVRLDRFRAAVRTLAADPPTVRSGDMVGDLGEVIAGVRTRVADEHVLVFSSWALTYVERSQRPRVVDVLEHVAADGTPVSWITAEPDGCVPGLPLVDRPETVLGVTRWRAGRRTVDVLGTCHPHGEWVELS
ncbi:DUF2332 domain-containing protein [Luteipulveratus halotolerans]|uniref:DUF2332 domain-containing protein n=1 Tax=Luteipulveratus halotolerans TaxID=1631356 RepID=A0A0L6CGP7_9MICO|nr:DUF2332 domain-containing protein [Luteipulveratus halotolerans]KNX36688.1 hypothetical protein VV01_05205 [Luteipulveratus halotolerans]